MCSPFQKWGTAAMRPPFPWRRFTVTAIIANQVPESSRIGFFHFHSPSLRLFDTQRTLTRLISATPCGGACLLRLSESPNVRRDGTPTNILAHVSQSTLGTVH